MRMANRSVGFPVRLDVEVYENFRAEAFCRGCSMASLVRRSIEEAPWYPPSMQRLTEYLIHRDECLESAESAATDNRSESSEHWLRTHTAGAGRPSE